MSYILDALRRAERERREGQAPVLEPESRRASPVTATDALRRWVPGLLIAIVLLLGLTVGLLLRRPADGPPSVIVVKPAETATSPVAAANPTPSARAPVASVAAPLPAPAAPAVAPPPSLAAEPAAAAAAAVAQVPEAPDGASGVPPLPPAAVAPQTPDSDALRAEAEAPDLEVQTIPRHRTRSSAAERPSARASAQVAARQLSQMPDAYRARFPTLTVDVHVYDDDPGRRFVIIAGQRYGEGDTLSGGPRLVQIVPEGMVLDWQGQRVLYALAR